MQNGLSFLEKNVVPFYDAVQLQKSCHFIFQKSCIDFAIQAKPLELYVPPETTGIRYHIW
jgi:hypothetical protein